MKKNTLDELLIEGREGILNNRAYFLDDSLAYKRILTQTEIDQIKTYLKNKHKIEY